MWYMHFWSGIFALVSRLSESACKPFKSRCSFPYTSVAFLNVLPVIGLLGRGSYAKGQLQTRTSTCPINKQKKFFLFYLTLFWTLPVDMIKHWLETSISTNLLQGRTSSLINNIFSTLLAPQTPAASWGSNCPVNAFTLPLAASFLSFRSQCRCYPFEGPPQSRASGAHSPAMTLMLACLVNFLALVTGWTN